MSVNTVLVVRSGSNCGYQSFRVHQQYLKGRGEVSTASVQLQEMFMQGVPESEGSTSSSLVQRCNHHSNRVLEALLEGSIASSSLSIATPNPSSQPHLHLTGAHQPQFSSMPCSPPLLSLANSLASWQLQQVNEVIRMLLDTLHVLAGG